MGGRRSWSCIFSAVHLAAATGYNLETERILRHSGLLTWKYFLLGSLSLYKMKQDG